MVKGKILITTWIVVTNPNITNINANYFYNDKIYALYGILDKNIGKFKVKMGLRVNTQILNYLLMKVLWVMITSIYFLLWVALMKKMGIIFL